MPNVLAKLDLYKDETALVTGSASNIGKGIAAGLAVEGAHVILADVDPDRNADTARIIRESGGSCEEITVDLSKPDGWKDLLPVIEGVVTAVDPDAGKMVVDPPEGLEGLS